MFAPDASCKGQNHLPVAKNRNNDEVETDDDDAKLMNLMDTEDVGPEVGQKLKHKKHVSTARPNTSAEVHHKSWQMSPVQDILRADSELTVC